MKSKLMKCDLCGAITVPNSFYVCNDCMDKDQKLFQQAKNSIKFNESVTIEEIHQRTGIEMKDIRRWVKTGRLLSD